MVFSFKFPIKAFTKIYQIEPSSQSSVISKANLQKSPLYRALIGMVRMLKYKKLLVSLAALSKYNFSSKMNKSYLLLQNKTIKPNASPKTL